MGIACTLQRASAVRAPGARQAVGGKAGCCRHGGGSDPAFPAACAAQSLCNSTSEQARVLAHGGDHGRDGSGKPGGLPLSGRKFMACFATVQVVSMINA